MQDILSRESAKKMKWESWILILVSPLAEIKPNKVPKQLLPQQAATAQGQLHSKDTPEGKITQVCITANWDHGAAVGTEHQAECWPHERESTFVPCFQPLLNYKRTRNFVPDKFAQIQKGNKNKATTAAFLFLSNYF